MSFLNVIAPRLSKRRFLLKTLRDIIYRPSSVLGRLTSTNFHNAKICTDLRIHCPVCGKNARMSYDFPDVRIRKAHGIGVLRETLGCSSCGATMRDRGIAVGILRVIAERSGHNYLDLQAYRLDCGDTLTILDTDSFSPINTVLRGLSGYKHSQFRPDLINGATLPDGSSNVNLQDIPFEANSFDIIITSDVMEHVLDDDQAHREIFRCLAPRGTYVFTVPYDPCLLENRTLTLSTGTGTSRFILERHVHGDPHSSSGIIAHRIYGQQLLDDLRAIGYAIRFQRINSPTEGIFGGDVFLARKEV